jgi:amidase
MSSDLTRRAVLAGATAMTAAPAAGFGAAAAPPAAPYRSAIELSNALTARKVSARELTDAAIARIEALDAKINAVVVRDFDRARQAAKAADAALARGEKRPLLGLPMTVKEQYNVAGFPTTWGYPRFKDWKPDFDALVVQRLKTAGAIILGKTNVPGGLGDWQSYNKVYGTTNNPWDLTRTPGGSSGGAAAALAAGYVPLELGSDIGGSLRAPAHFCGICAHKPSIDLMPQRGSGFPESPPIPVVSDMLVGGPMARSAADLALELDVIAGPDPMWEGIGYKLALPPPRHAKLADYRVLVLDEHPLCPTTNSVRGALDTLAGKLAKAGCQVSRNNPNQPNLARTTRNYAELLAAFFDLDLSPEERVKYAAEAQVLSPENQSLTTYGLRGWTISHPEWIRASLERTFLRSRSQALFQDIDVLLCPPMPTVAFPQDQSEPQEDRVLDIDGKKVPYDSQIAWCAIATPTGLPATVMPIDHDAHGLPIGVQIVGGFLDDHTTIAFAGMVEREFGGFTPPPNYAETDIGEDHIEQILVGALAAVLTENSGAFWGIEWGDR